MMEKILPQGWGFSMAIVRLPDGGLFVHSPIHDGDDTFTELEKLGAPSIFFAPNHFHHLSVPKFVARYPNALLVASEQAIARLKKKGHATVKPWKEALPKLPAGTRFLDAQGTKSGESWVVVPGDDGPTLIVCDTFFNWTRKVTGVMGVGLRALKVVPGLRVSKTFQWLQMKDLAVYRDWATKTVRALQPKRVIFSHGEPLQGPGVANQLEEAVRAALG